LTSHLSQSVEISYQINNCRNFKSICRRNKPTIWLHFIYFHT